MEEGVTLVFASPSQSLKPPLTAWHLKRNGAICHKMEIRRSNYAWLITMEEAEGNRRRIYDVRTGFLFSFIFPPYKDTSWRINIHQNAGNDVFEAPNFLRENSTLPASYVSSLMLKQNLHPYHGFILHEPFLNRHLQCGCYEVEENRTEWKEQQ